LLYSTSTSSVAQRLPHKYVPGIFTKKVKGKIKTLPNYARLMTQLTVSAAITPLPQYACISCTRKIVLSFLLSVGPNDSSMKNDEGRYLPPTWPTLATLEGGSCTKNMISTRGCSYSFVYSWWWVWLTPETCRVNLQNNKQTVFCCISLDNY